MLWLADPESDNQILGRNHVQDLSFVSSRNDLKSMKDHDETNRLQTQKADDSAANSISFMTIQPPTLAKQQKSPGRNRNNSTLKSSKTQSALNQKKELVQSSQASVQTCDKSSKSRAKQKLEKLMGSRV